MHAEFRKILDVGTKAQKVMSNPDARRQELQVQVPAQYRPFSLHQGVLPGLADWFRKCGIMRSG